MTNNKKKGDKKNLLNRWYRMRERVRKGPCGGFLEEDG